LILQAEFVDIYLGGYDWHMISLESKQLKKLEVTLELLAKDGFPKATRDTLNMTAANARKSARRLISEKMTIRGSKNNNPALFGVQFEQTQSLNPANQVSKVGHIAKFWPTQEFGGLVIKKGQDGVPIPTSAASNQRGAAVRTRMVSKRNKLGNIKLSRDAIRAKTRQQRNAILIAQARKRGNPKEVFLDLGKRKGIFRVQRNAIVMIYDLTRNAVWVPARPAIIPAAERQAAFIPENFERALRFQIKRARRR